MVEEMDLFDMLSKAKDYIANVRDKMIDSENKLAYQVLDLLDDVIDNVIAYEFGGGIIDDVNLLKSIVLTIDALQNVVSNDAKEKLAKARNLILKYVEAREKELEENEAWYI